MKNTISNCVIVSLTIFFSIHATQIHTFKSFVMHTARGLTALDLAIQEGQSDIVQTLLRCSSQGEILNARADSTEMLISNDDLGLKISNIRDLTIDVSNSSIMKASKYSPDVFITMLRELISSRNNFASIERTEYFYRTTMDPVPWDNFLNAIYKSLTLKNPLYTPGFTPSVPALKEALNQNESNSLKKLCETEFHAGRDANVVKLNITLPFTTENVQVGMGEYEIHATTIFHLIAGRKKPDLDFLWEFAPPGVLTTPSAITHQTVAQILTENNRNDILTQLRNKKYIR